MAAPLTYARIRAQNCLKIVRFSSPILNLKLNLRYQTNKATDLEFDNEQEELEEEINKIRNVSNLPPWQYTKYKGQMNELPDNEYMKSRKFLRKMYAKYGADSGVDPSIMWPSKPELAELIEDEKEWEPTFQQRVKTALDKKEKEQEEIDKRQKRIEAQMAKMDSMIQDYKKRQEKAPNKEKEMGQKQQELLEEAVEYYGFRVEPKSDLYRHFIDLKIEAQRVQKKAARKAKRKEKDDSKKIVIKKEDTVKAEKKDAQEDIEDED